MNRSGSAILECNTIWFSLGELAAPHANAAEPRTGDEESRYRIRSQLEGGNLGGFLPGPRAQVQLNEPPACRDLGDPGS